MRFGSFLLAVFLANASHATERPPTWVSAPYLKGGVATTFCLDGGDRRLEFAFARAMQDVAEQIETILREVSNGMRDEESQDSEKAKSGGSEILEKRISQALGPHVFVEGRVRSAQTMSGGRYESKFESLARVSFHNDDKTRKRVLKLYASSVERDEASEFEQKFEVEDGALAWQEVVTLLLEDTRFHLYSDYIDFSDGITRLCAFVGYIAK